MSFNVNDLKPIIEAVLMASEQPLSVTMIAQLLTSETVPNKEMIREALELLQEDCAGRGIDLKEVASGFRYQAKQEYAHWISKLWEERAPRYSRAFLETLVLIAYRQPITRAEIEEIRGVTVNSNIIKGLIEREWIKVVGQREVPGKPELLGTTKEFLDYFNLKSLTDLPALSDIQDIDQQAIELERQLQLQVVTLDDNTREFVTENSEAQ
ncbi:MAG: SMC-Scp complex subunit ScpB [Gammaproteobacteria bacterium]|nr:SMC-Scp complex subunit ScpB [Gammaproteobacteria bacterium]